MAITNEEALMDGLEKLSDILSEATDKLDDLADSYGTVRRNCTKPHG